MTDQSRMANWLDDTAESIRCTGPSGMAQDYCEMVSDNLLKIADYLRQIDDE